MLTNKQFNICAPRTEKSKFYSLVAYLKQQEDWEELERNPKESPAKGKKGGKKPAKETKKKEEPKKKGGRKAKAPVVEEEAEDETEEVEKSEEPVAPAKGGRKAIVKEESEESEEETEKDEGTASDDEENDNAPDFEKLKGKLAKLKEGEYLDVQTGKVVSQTPELIKSHKFHDDPNICVKKEKTDRATQSLLVKFANELAEED